MEWHTARVPESLGSLTGLEYLDLCGCKILDPDKKLKTLIARQISGLNLTSLTELYLGKCGLKDGSIPDEFGSLSSLIVLDLSQNDFVDLPTCCFSSLFQLLYLFLDDCKRLKSLPRLPPRLIRLGASFCYSMKPLSDIHLWDLVASLDHEYRWGTKYVNNEVFNDISLWLKYTELEYLPQRDFCAIIPGRKIPLWFPNKEYYPWDESRKESVIKVDILQYFRASEWSGIAICLLFSGPYECLISWSSKALEDDEYTWKEWAHYISSSRQSSHLCVMVLELNEKTCWQHLRGHNNSLHIKLSTYPVINGAEDVKIGGWGWRVICKEDIQEWCNLNGFNQVMEPHLAGPDEVRLSQRLLDKVIRKVPEHVDLARKRKKQE